jgi:hypothetical protein
LTATSVIATLAWHAAWGAGRLTLAGQAAERKAGPVAKPTFAAATIIAADLAIAIRDADAFRDIVGTAITDADARKITTATTRSIHTAISRATEPGIDFALPTDTQGIFGALTA